jgi:hypothetical protein
MEENMAYPPETMGKLLYTLTGPPTLNTIVDEFKDKIS